MRSFCKFRKEDECIEFIMISQWNTAADYYWEMVWHEVLVDKKKEAQEK